MIVELFTDQSRHRAAKDDPRHHRWTAEVAALDFRFIIKRLVGEERGGGQALVKPWSNRVRYSRPPVRSGLWLGANRQEPSLNPLYETMATSVFERMSGLAGKHGAINLGQGFPDFGWPDAILEEAARALRHGSNQYAPSRGLPALREAIAAHYGRHHGQPLDAGQICVTSGATEAISAAILASVTPGDEVIIFTPAYDCYAPMIRRAGGVVREIALRPPRWRIDYDTV